MRRFTALRLAVITCLWGIATYVAAEPTVVNYPAPAGEKLSTDYELRVAGKTVPVYLCRVSAMPFNQVWPGYQRPLDQTELASFAYWDMAGPVDVEVVSQQPVKSVAIRPTVRGIKPTVDGNRIRFRLDKPQQITVEVNGWHKALHLFADAPEASAPTAETPNVRYFGPGVHRPGKIVVQSNQTVYLAGGAVVYGCIEATDAQNIKILGRGIIDTSDFPRRDKRDDDHEKRVKNVIRAAGCVHLLRCKNVIVDGIILRDPNVWCLSAFDSSDIAISNVKLIGLWRYNADGIDICNSQRVVVRNCFVRSYDDSLVVKGMGLGHDSPVRDVLFEGCVVWNDWGRALELGAETSASEFTNVAFRDCDIIRTCHIALDVQHSDATPIKNVLFERIRVEVDDVNYRPSIQNNRDAKYVQSTKYCPQFLVLVIRNSPYSHDKERGTIQNVAVRDCSIWGNPVPSSTIRGFDAQHEIKDVTISNLSINGKIATTLAEAKVSVGPFVSDVRILSSP